MRTRFSLKQLFIASALVAGGVGAEVYPSQDMASVILWYVSGLLLGCGIGSLAIRPFFGAILGAAAGFVVFHFLGIIIAYS